MATFSKVYINHMSIIETMQRTTIENIVKGWPARKGAPAAKQNCHVLASKNFKFWF